MNGRAVPIVSPTQLREVLRTAHIALQDRLVALWEASASGEVVPVATSEGPLTPSATDEFNTALGAWHVARPEGRRWLGCQLDQGRWCIAPVRDRPPAPAPEGRERRRGERMTLELAARCLGLLQGTVAEPAPVREGETALERDQRELEDFFDQAAVALHWIGPGGIILRANRAELELLGCAEDEYVGHHIGEFYTDREVIDGLLRRVMAGETVRDVEARLRCKDGTIRDVIVSSNARFDARGRFLHTRCFTRDITEWKLADAQLRHGALHDRLTNLPNRTLFFERVAQALQRRDRDPDYAFAVMFVDGDHFKAVNDSLGHNAGDQLLAALAQRLEAASRPGDVIARLAGDEFTLFLEDVDQLHAVRVAERIQAELGAPFLAGGQELFLTASIGITLSAPDYTRPEDMLRDAEIAMYRAKAQGRSRHEVFDPAMRDRARRRLRLVMDLRRAVERREFRVFYQPILDLRSGRLEGFEALVRWEHPEGGLMAPVEFIGAAEETGLIVPLGSWVLREACRQTRMWQLAHPRPVPIRIGINVSARQIHDGSLLDHVTSALLDSGLESRCLRLEITENALLEGVDEVWALLQHLHALQVQLQLDDFGTGYSSLGYLRRFPLDALKIDRSFVRRLGVRRGDTELVRTIVALAQNLGLGVVAEGVESAVQRDRLLELGCHLGQGFFFAEPLPPGDVEARLWG